MQEFDPVPGQRVFVLVEDATAGRCSIVRGRYVGTTTTSDGMVKLRVKSDGQGAVAAFPGDVFPTIVEAVVAASQRRWEIARGAGEDDVGETQPL